MTWMNESLLFYRCYFLLFWSKFCSFCFTWKLSLSYRVERREFKKHGALFSLDFFNQEWFRAGLFSVKHFPNKKSFFNSVDKNNKNNNNDIIIVIR